MVPNTMTQTTSSSKPYTILSIFLLLLILLPSLSLSTHKCNPNDKTVLLKIKSHFDAPDETYFDNWDVQTDCCKWNIVECNNEGRVNSLTLSLWSQTSHEIPSVIGDLPYLEFLRILNQNRMLVGSIPDSIGNLINLQTLDLNTNNLSGPIPAALGKLTQLRYLDLQLNFLSGSIPSSLGHLTKLTYLNFYMNQLSGKIPSSIGQLTSLHHLDLGSNSLSGHIPQSFVNLNNLILLDLRFNQLSGSIPEGFGSFTNTSMQLFLSSNKLSGQIPTSMSQANISLIDLSGNNLSGDASFLLGRNKTALTVLYLQYNKLSFNFSKVEFPLTLTYLFIQYNQIYGSLPEQLGQLSDLVDIDVSNNQLCGPIPDSPNLHQFAAYKFENNKCLCGDPLPPCMSNYNM